MSKMNRLDVICQEWKDPEEDPTGYELLKDEINEHLNGKKKLDQLGDLAQMVMGQWIEENQYQPEHART